MVEHDEASDHNVHLGKALHIMADSIIASGDARPAPTSGGNAAKLAAPSVVNIEEDVTAARKLNDLIDWIGQARQFIANMAAASRDPGVDAVMRNHGFVAGPEWAEEFEGVGLYYAHRAIDEHLAAALGERRQ